jgi:hypothetical protein
MTTARKRKSRETPRAIPLAKATEQRARLASAQADLAELKAAERRGELLAAAEVTAAWCAVLRTVRSAMLAVPSRVGARLPHLTTLDIARDRSRGARGARRGRGRRRLTARALANRSLAGSHGGRWSRAVTPAFNPADIYRRRLG